MSVAIEYVSSFYHIWNTTHSHSQYTECHSKEQDPPPERDKRITKDKKRHLLHIQDMYRVEYILYQVNL